MRLHEIIYIGELETKRGYAITKKNISPKDKRVFVNNFFEYPLLKEKEVVHYVNYLERILKEGECFIINHGEFFIEGEKMFIKNNKTPMIFAPESGVIVKDMTNNY